jgi:ferrous iron transport protein B
MTKPITIGIAGNPNCGKTTLFNSLTGTRQQVGNWPGVTVDRKSGRYHDEGAVNVIDLPGVYTLGSLPGIESLDEQIAQEAILQDDIQVVVNVIDVTNLERNLYLTAQLSEMHKPMVIALNMMDLSRKNGMEIDPRHLAEHLGCPVVPLSANTGEGISELKRAIREAAATGLPPSVSISYGHDLETAINEIALSVRGEAEDHGIDPRWLSVKLLEEEARALSIAGPGAASLLNKRLSGLAIETGEDADILIADARYDFANHLAHHVVKRKGTVGRAGSDILDRILLHRFFGLPIFLGLMYLMFMFTINLGGVFIDFFDMAAETLFVDAVSVILISLGSPDWLRVVVANGFGGGLQVVATFIPIIGFLYLFLSLLEDSGYMARAAFLMDRYLRKIGLPGKAFVPLIVGFGCNVPAIMATRTLE